MTEHHRVRCSPLGRRERVADVVDEEITSVPDQPGPVTLLTVDVDGHHFRVDAADCEPIEDEAA